MFVNVSNGRNHAHAVAVRIYDNARFPWEVRDAAMNVVEAVEVRASADELRRKLNTLAAVLGFSRTLHQFDMQRSAARCAGND